MRKQGFRGAKPRSDGDAFVVTDSSHGKRPPHCYEYQDSVGMSGSSEGTLGSADREDGGLDINTPPYDSLNTLRSTTFKRMLRPPRGHGDHIDLVRLTPCNMDLQCYQLAQELCFPQGTVTHQPHDLVLLVHTVL